MNIKSIFFIALGSLLTATALNNRQEVSFWFFGMHSVSLLWLLGGTFVIGLIGGIVLSRPRKAKKEATAQHEDELDSEQEDRGGLNEADRDYIS